MHTRTKELQPEYIPAKRDEYVFSVKIREDDKESPYELEVSKIALYFGSLLLLTGGGILLFSGVYALTIWWWIVPQFEFWEFMGSVILFPITIPLSPIYLGVKGDWGPAGIFIFGMGLGFLLLKVGSRLYKLDPTRIGSSS